METNALATIKQEAWAFYSAEKDDNSRMDEAVKKAGQTDDLDQLQDQSS